MRTVLRRPDDPLSVQTNSPVYANRYRNKDNSGFAQGNRVFNVIDRIERVVRARSV